MTSKEIDAPDRGIARVGLLERFRGASFVVGVGAVAALSAPLCFFAMFSGFADHDDEGYLLLSLRQYARGGILYDQLYSQYGPAYFQTVTALFAGLGLEFTHTAGRAMVMGLWLAVAVICGVATYRLTGNAPVALATQLLTGQALVSLRNEPLHPGGVLSLVVSGLVLCGAWAGRQPGHRAVMALGACVGSALVMKVNIGVFAGVATGFAILVRLARRPGARTAVAAAFLLVPPAVMGGLLGAGWVRTYLVVVECAAVAVVLIELSEPGRGRGARRAAGALVLTVVVTVAVVCGWQLARGSSVTGLLRGIVLDPMSHPYVLAIPPLFSATAPMWALTSVAVALLVTLVRRRGWTDHRVAVALRGPLQLLAGTFIWLAASDQLLVSPLAALPLLWVALITPTAEVHPDRAFGRSLLVAVAVLQGLHAYPVAASQVAWATFLFIPVGALAVADGWRATVVAVRREGLDSRRLRAASVFLGAVLVGLAAKSVYDEGQRYRAMYEAGVPLDLPGADSIRVTERQATLYRALTVNLAAHCGTFVSMPGLNSLYLFSRLEPPTMMNATVWMSLFTPAQQVEIARRLSRVTVPMCAVRRLRATWRNPTLYDTPLGRYIDAEFRTILVVDQYEFMVRRTSSRVGYSTRQSGLPGP